MRRWRFFRNSKVKFAHLSPKTLWHPGHNREMIMGWRLVTLARWCSACRGPRYKRSRTLSPSYRYYEASCRMRPRVIRAHQPGSEPIDIPETIPNPVVVPKPTPTPTEPAPKEPVRIPEKVP